jgi:hypothetical protein
LLALFLVSGSACSEEPPADDDDQQERDSAVERDASVERRDARAEDDARVGPRDAQADAQRDAQPAKGDASTNDAADAGATCVDFVAPTGIDCSAPADGVLPRDLRCTGLYGNFAERRIACGLLEYKPAVELWSDDAAKRRWVSIPKGKKVDVSNPMEFVFPDGTRFWKEFRVRASDGSMRLAETRLLEKRGEDWLRTSYVWSEDQRQAIQMDNVLGVPNLYGTGHVVPTRDQCVECHGGRNDIILGWDALMLGPGAEGLTREKLVELGLIEGGALTQTIPGNEVEKAALGYLHANCGISCHNDNPLSKGKDSGLYLRLEPGELGSVQMTDAFKTAINKRPATNAKYEGLDNRDPEHWYDIRPGDPARSLMIARQTMRGTEAQMPKIGTNHVDDAGVQIVTRWIQSMTRDAGYPAPTPEDAGAR